MKQLKTRRLDLIGTFDTVLKLETAIYREVGVRFVLRIKPGVVIPQPNDLLRRIRNDWEPDGTVAAWRDVLISELNKQWGSARTITKEDVDVITTHGLLASGNMLIKNCRYDVE